MAARLQNGPMMKPDLETFRSLPLLQAFPDYLLPALIETAEVMDLGPQENMFQVGERLSKVHYLLSGQVGTTRSRGGPEDDLVDVLLPVQPLFLPAVLLELPLPFGAYTLTAAQFITLSANRLRDMISNDPRLAWPFIEYGLRQAHQQVLEISDLKLKSSPQRLAEYLLGLINDPEEIPARFVLPLRKELIAVKLGCTPESLSRAFAALDLIGVRTYKGGVVVSDVPALRAAANTYFQKVPPRRSQRITA